MTKLIVAEEKINDELNQWFWAGLDSDKEEQRAPLFREKPLQVVAYDNDGKRLAALAGTICWDWLYVDMIWVESSYRRQGLGASLIRQAEEKASQSGCVGVYLWTQSFQAPKFYEKLGYQQFVVIQDFPKGHQRLGFMKRLAEDRK